MSNDLQIAKSFIYKAIGLNDERMDELSIGAICASVNSLIREIEKIKVQISPMESAEEEESDLPVKEELSLTEKIVAKLMKGKTVLCNVTRLYEPSSTFPDAISSKGSLTWTNREVTGFDNQGRFYAEGEWWDVAVPVEQLLKVKNQ